MRIARHGKNLVLKFRYNPSIVSLVKKMTGAKWNPKVKVWTVLDCEHNIFLLESEYPRVHWECPIKPVTDFNRPLFQHQRDIVSFILNRRIGFISATMGVGKTLSSIEIMERSNIENWWYIAPKSALLSVEFEMDKWGCEVYPVFLTYEGLVKRLKTHTGISPEGVIFDESHKLKTPTSIRTRAAQFLTENMREEHEDPFIICMTGTPAPKNPLDWWSQLETLRPGFIPEGNWYKFRERVAKTITVDLGEDDTTKAGHSYSTIESWKEVALAEFHKFIKDTITIFVDKADCLDLPEKIYTEMVVPMTSQVESRYRFILTNSGTTIEALNKCRQLSDGFIYSDGKAIRVTANPKLEMLKDLVVGKNRVVIFAGFIESINLVKEEMEKLGWRVINSGDKNFKYGIRDFMNTSIDEPIAFVNHPKSGGTGLNLTASDTIIYYSNDFDGESRMQSEDRIHRPGCKGANIIDLYHLPTDKYVRMNLANKVKLQGVTISDMKLELGKINWSKHDPGI